MSIWWPGKLIDQLVGLAILEQAMISIPFRTLALAVAFRRRDGVFFHQRSRRLKAAANGISRMRISWHVYEFRNSGTNGAFECFAGFGFHFALQGFFQNVALALF